MKYYAYKIYSYNGEFYLKLRRLPLGLWEDPTDILRSHNISNNLSMNDDFVRNKSSLKSGAETSLNNFAEKISDYRSPRKKGLDKGSLFTYKVINEL